MPGPLGIAPPVRPRRRGRRPELRRLRLYRPRCPHTGGIADLGGVDGELTEQAAPGDERRDEAGEERDRSGDQCPQSQLVGEQHAHEDGQEEDRLQLEREGDTEPRGSGPGAPADERHEAGEAERRVDRVALRPDPAVHHHGREQGDDGERHEREPLRAGTDGSDKP